MAKTQVRGTQVLDGTVQRADLDVSTVGQAVIRKLVQGTNVSLSSTGADAGTGDVTISVPLTTGPQGPQGIQGNPGSTGATGPGVPAGGAAGSILKKKTTTDFDTEWDTPAFAQVTSPANPPGVAGATAKMNGYGTATYGPFLFTPQFTGKVILSINFGMACDTANATLVAALKYGTGTPPVNGALATGSSGSSFVRAGPWAINQNGSVTLTWIVSGLTPGTQYWVDVATQAGAGQTVSVAGGFFSAVEFP